MQEKSSLKDIDRKKFQQIYNDREKFPTVPIVASIFGISERTVRVWVKKFINEGIQLIDRSKNGANQPKDVSILKERTKREYVLEERISNLNLKLDTLTKENRKLKEAPPLKFEERLEVKKFRDELGRLQRDLREAEKQALTSNSLKSFIWGMDKHDFGGYPDWMKQSKKKISTHGIPCLFLSDIHFDEFVDGSQINFVNDYNREIAIKRIQHTFNTTIDILFNRTVKPSYDGLVIALGGDLLSGNIHEELAETNEDAIMRSLLVLTDLLIDGINLHLEYFKNIFVVGVVGNHGRLHKKVRAKNKVFDNYEWLVLQFLARHFKDDKRITFQIPDGPDAIFQIYNQRFLLTHGDQFKGGNAIAGIFSPLMLGYHRKQKKQSSINKNFDVMMVGHFHQYVHTNNLVINGSIKGYCEFANQCNFSFERPQQSLWINHPQEGMVFRTPIFCDSYKKIDFNKTEKIVVIK